MTNVRIKVVQLAKPGQKETSGPMSAVQIVDAETGYSMGAGLWSTRALAEQECKRKRWRVIADERAVA